MRKQKVCGGIRKSYSKSYYLMQNCTPHFSLILIGILLVLLDINTLKKKKKVLLNLIFKSILCLALQEGLVPHMDRHKH